MESIEALREYAGRFGNSHDPWSGIARDLSSIADAIEREVGCMRDFCERLDDAATKREDVTLWGVDYMPLPVDADGVPIHVGGYDAGFASADDLIAQHEDAMAEHGWVRLPVDEDGDVLHIGELVDEMLPFGGYAAPAPIDTMELSRGASGYRWMVKLDAENSAFISPKLLRHYHAPTVEDVLREFADAMSNTHPVDVPARIAEYAAKLRLAGDE